MAAEEIGEETGGKGDRRRRGDCRRGRLEETTDRDGFGVYSRWSCRLGQM
jgi:hypothetical protein